MEPPSTDEEHIFALGVIGVRNAAVDRTYRRTFFAFKKTDTFSAPFGHDVVDILG
jgi:hypothetical protein